MSNSTRRGNETAGPGPLDVKKLQNLFTSSESIVLEGLDDLRQQKGETSKGPGTPESGKREKPAAPAGAGDPLRPSLRPQRAVGEGVFGPASQPGLPLCDPGTSGAPGGGKPFKAASWELTARRAATGAPKAAAREDPARDLVAGPAAEGAKNRAPERKLPQRRDSQTPPRQFAADLPGIAGAEAAPSPVRQGPERDRRAAVREETEGRKRVTPSSDDPGKSGEVLAASGATFGTPAETRERWGLGSVPGTNRKHMSPGALVACAVLVQTGITLLLAAVLWKAFGSKWMEREVELRVAESGMATAAAADPLSAGGLVPSAAGLVREEALLVLSTLADHALVTGERRFLEEFYRTYNSAGLDRLVYRFAVAKEGTVLAAFRDRPARYSLQVDAVLPESGKTRESQLSAMELTGIMADGRRPRLERARAAYLLRSTRDYQVVDQLAEVMRDEQDLEVLVNALYAFVAITACEEVEGFNVSGLLEWWSRNRTDLLARSPASGE
ncbi:MAG TPA: hypothetical protein VMN36_12600 [Verrucomicrobiales bacterium]|nr:hypothetical protein [Verrucomicrobiales bacterium]